MSDNGTRVTLIAERDALQRTVEQLVKAVASRTIIGQAEGILMARLDIDADHAMDYLRRVSSCSNRKLADIAAEIAETRELPEFY